MLISLQCDACVQNGASGSGTPIHDHPLTVAWNALLAGCKLWVAMPPDVDPAYLLLDTDDDFDLSALQVRPTTAHHHPYHHFIIQQQQNTPQWPTQPRSLIILIIWFFLTFTRVSHSCARSP